MRKIRQIADDLNFGVIRNGQVVVYHHSTNAIDRRAERLPNEGGGVAGGPDLHPARDKFVANLQSILGKIRRVSASSHFDSKLSELFHRAFLKVCREGREHAGMSLH